MAFATRTLPSRTYSTPYATFVIGSISTWRESRGSLVPQRRFYQTLADVGFGYLKNMGSHRHVKVRPQPCWSQKRFACATPGTSSGCSLSYHKPGLILSVYVTVFVPHFDPGLNKSRRQWCVPRSFLHGQIPGSPKH